MTLFNPARRQLLAGTAAAAGLAALPLAQAQPPSSATYERAPFEIAAETLAALGFKVREAPNARARRGHHAGTAEQRAADIHSLVADPGVHGLLAVTGGSGANRVLPLLDYAAIARTPKVIAGFSDVTALLNAVTARTGLVTFHAPVVVSEWNAFSVAEFRAVLMDAEARTLRNVADKGDNLVAKDNRISTLRPGLASGPLVGGNLAASAARNGWAGLVVDGCVRDVAELAQADVGIRALALMPLPTERRQPGLVDVPVTIQGVRVQPGDWLVADADGIVVLAAAPSA
ncbi:MAG: hypothetical protein CFE45_14830 [Burkholderiales bacterium PBB5]|nr:MAG: hypothetical protein CFE45_14830 [Burkholderiales bacterium PBB5]